MSQAEPEVVVEAVGLQKVFYDFWHRPKAAAVNGISFEVKRGEVLGFLGPNGSGKSTTVKMILGLLKPTSGSLRTFRQPPTHVETKLRIGYLPEETYLYRYLTAIETLDFFGSLFRLGAEQKKKRIAELLKMVGMQGAANRPVGEFSKGMARRIGLAQALINDPDLVVLDEPTSGLDPIGCREIKDVIKTLAKRGKTVILCSHLLADVQDVCDNVLIMYGGKVRAQGALDKLLNVEEKTRITTPKLEPELLQKIIEFIHEAFPESEAQVDSPTKSLEDFFMDVVNKAREESMATAGVSETGQIASFLAGEEGEEQRRDEMLKSLTQEEPGPAPEPETMAKPEREVQPDVERLEELTKDEPKDEAEPEPPVDSPVSDEEREAKNKAIQDLLDHK